ncbi:hypothetical protein CN423_23725 [Bacillus cereus]|uniref:hypothetical protein n=1 Tax=Bacillus cereus TaxID=1396 RepID=UPI000BECAFB9|nr:hypothetical protein [Bacillus cereus]PED00076.1 hypothetical protein CON14_25985 [Bacillus cereus]PEQ27271.1 hypothetical protein CN466_28535 [Bacillus cereus]PEV60130.1 hypothetical protein CN423_23725 [Bacillus cereus]PEX59165.1 hypothetical protein CN463_22920 [Bacillus cereus]PFC28178.1 hypothetical protein CN264_06630 [Bacillus cereus]
MSEYNNKKVSVGKRFGRLVVLEDTGKRNNSKRKIFLCECDCGKKVEVDIAGLRTGDNQSCGCLRLEKVTKHSSSCTKLYKKWADMLQRCNNPNSTNYKYYGERGIKGCDEWYDFVVFKKWADENGYTERLSIDRIDPNGNYEPENCRWVTRKQQDRNKRDSIFVWIHREHLNLMDAAEKYDVSYGCLKYRYHKGIRGEKLISPSQRGKKLE